MLIEKDDQGNWRVKGLPWKKLYTGEQITEDVFEKLYACLWRLMEYEDTGLDPEQVEMIRDGLTACESRAVDVMPDMSVGLEKTKMTVQEAIDILNDYRTALQEARDTLNSYQIGCSKPGAFRTLDAVSVAVSCLERLQGGRMV